MSDLVWCLDMHADEPTLPEGAVRFHHPQSLSEALCALEEDTTVELHVHFHDAADVRRVAAPYEDRQAVTNGDVPELAAPGPAGDDP